MYDHTSFTAAIFSFECVLGTFPAHSAAIFVYTAAMLWVATRHLKHIGVDQEALLLVFKQGTELLQRRLQLFSVVPFEGGVLLYAIL